MYRDIGANDWFFEVDETDGPQLWSRLETIVRDPAAASAKARAIMAGVEKRQRRERFAEVMAGQRDFSAEELDAELNDLRLTLAALGATQEEELSADQFLELLRHKARLLVQPGSGAEETDLAEAIRRQLQAG